MRVFLVLHLSEDMWKKFYLIEKEIHDYIARFEVCRFNIAVTLSDEKYARSASHRRPEELKDLVSCLMEWYKTWAPPEE